MIYFNNYKPKQLKVVATRLEKLKRNNKILSFNELIELKKSVYVRDLSLEEIKLILLNIERYTIHFSTDEICETLDTVKISSLEKKEKDLEYIIYFTLLKTFKNKNIQYHIKKLGKKLRNYMEIHAKLDEFKLNIQKFLKNGNNQNFIEFLKMEREKYVIGSKEELFLEEYMILKTDEIYEEIVLKK